jgi:hypothetical protein
MAQRVWIDMHGADLEDDARERLQRQMEIAMGVDGRAPIMEGGATLEGLGVTANDEVLTRGLDTAHKFIRYTLGLPEDEEDDKAFYSRVVSPIAEGMEAEWERTLMPEFTPAAYPQFMFRQILQGTPEEQARYWQIEILSAQATPNDSRLAQDREPLPGGDELFVPLNLVPISMVGELAQRKADSAGGIGGSQGRGITPQTPSSRPLQAVGAGRARAEGNGSLPFMMRVYGAANWESARSRLISSQGTALERRFRGVVGKEGNRLRELIAPLDRTPTKGAPYEGLDPALVASEMDTTDGEIRTVMVNAMSRTAQEAYRLSVQLVEGIDAQAVAPDRLQLMVTDRANEIVDAFRARRLEVLERVERDGGDSADVFRSIAEEWDKLSNHLTNVIGRTETAWAFERAAAQGWESKGFGEFAVQLRSSNGSCRLGTCPAAAERTYVASEVPTPLHPGDDCFVVPVELSV